MNIKIAASIAVLSIAAMGMAHAATYTYDANTADWYTAGNFTRAHNTDPSLQYLMNDDTVSNAIRGTFYNRDAFAWEVFYNSWGGATWQAPAGERIVKVILGGWYRSDAGFMAVGLFGGSSAFEEKKYLDYKAPGGDPSVFHSYSGKIVDIASSDNCSMLELRSYWMDTPGHTELVHGSNVDGSFHGDISSVEIVTETNMDVTGTVVLADYGQSLKGVAISLDIRQNQNVVSSQTILLDSGGKFFVPGLANGNYDFSIKACSWLRKTVTGVQVMGATNLGTITLTNGDIDGDNEITSTDLSILGLGLGIAGD